MNHQHIRNNSSQADAGARQGVAIFLTLYSLISLYNSTIKDPVQLQKATATWTLWGVIFVILAFFIIVPEQAALQKKG